MRTKIRILFEISHMTGNFFAEDYYRSQVERAIPLPGMEHRSLDKNAPLSLAPRLICPQASRASACVTAVAQAEEYFPTADGILCFPCVTIVAQGAPRMEAAMKHHQSPPDTVLLSFLRSFAPGLSLYLNGSRVL